MKFASKKFPEGLVAGILPKSYGQKDLKGRQTQSTMSLNTNRSNISNMSSASKKNFDRDDVENLNHYLDEILMPASNRLSSSRGSTRASNATNASLASQRTLTSIHEKPFK